MEQFASVLILKLKSKQAERLAVTSALIVREPSLAEGSSVSRAVRSARGPARSADTRAARHAPTHRRGSTRAPLACHGPARARSRITAPAARRALSRSLAQSRRPHAPGRAAVTRSRAVRSAEPSPSRGPLRPPPPRSAAPMPPRSTVLVRVYVQEDYVA